MSTYEPGELTLRWRWPARLFGAAVVAVVEWAWLRRRGRTWSDRQRPPHERTA